MSVNWKYGLLSHKKRVLLRKYQLMQPTYISNIGLYHVMYSRYIFMKCKWWMMYGQVCFLEKVTICSNTSRWYNVINTRFKGYLCGVECHFQQYFSDIPVISWRSVLLVWETEVSGENHRPVASHWQTVSHNVVSCTPRHERDSNSDFLWS